MIGNYDTKTVGTLTYLVEDGVIVSEGYHEIRAEECDHSLVEYEYYGKRGALESRISTISPQLVKETILLHHKK